MIRLLLANVVNWSLPIYGDMFGFRVPGGLSPIRTEPRFLAVYGSMRPKLENSARWSLRDMCCWKLRDDSPCYSQRKTLAEIAVKSRKNTVSAATSPKWAHHPSPFHIPSSSRTA